MHFDECRERSEDSRVKQTYAWIVLAALGVMFAGGCAPAPAGKQAGDATAKSEIPNPPPDRPGHPTAAINPVDACSDRLQDLAGSLLFYYAINKRLPPNLNDLQDVNGEAIPTEHLTCPVSHKPYIYDLRGIPAGNGKPGLIVLADPEPSHSGLRWAITVEKPKNPTQPLITHLVAVPETTFHNLPDPSLPDRGGKAK
jgi:hypothetical protein